MAKKRSNKTKKSKENSASKALKITFWTVFTIIFIITTIIIAKTIYEKTIDSILGGSNEPEIIITDTTFTCENDGSTNIGYIYLRGFGDNNPGSVYFITDSTDAPLLDFDYDESHSLEDINSQFVSEFIDYTSENKLDKIIILGHSAGGVITSSTITEISSNFQEQVEIHTLASPLNGYNAPESLFAGYTGIYNDLATGIDAYDPEPSNIQVYHHKTVTDEILEDICGKFSKFCDALDAQNNNVPGSEEFYYAEEDHNGIVHTVGNKVIACNQ